MKGFALFMSFLMFGIWLFYIINGVFGIIEFDESVIKLHIYSFGTTIPSSLVFYLVYQLMKKDEEIENIKKLNNN